MTGGFWGMLRDLAAWWAEQMRALLPAGLARRDRPDESGLIVAADQLDDADALVVSLTQRRGRGEAAVGRFRLDEGGIVDARRALSGRPRPRAVVLRVPGTVLLEREVALPAAAEREAERVLGYEMDRLTPFSAAEVFWTWSVARRDRARGRSFLRLSLLPRAAVAGVLAALERVGIPPTVIAVAAPGGGARMIALDHARAGGGWKHRLAAAAAVACAVLGLAAVATPFALQSMQLSAVEDRIAAARPAVERVEALRRRIAGDQAGADVVAAERARTGDVLEVLATLTDVLPDDTYLTDFTLNQGKLGLAGQSAAAAKLIPALAAEPALRNPTFIAPVTRTETGGSDLFSIRAELAP